MEDGASLLCSALPVAACQSPGSDLLFALLFSLGLAGAVSIAMLSLISALRVYQNSL